MHNRTRLHPAYGTPSAQMFKKRPSLSIVTNVPKSESCDSMYYSFSLCIAMHKEHAFTLHKHKPLPLSRCVFSSDVISQNLKPTIEQPRVCFINTSYTIKIYTRWHFESVLHSLSNVFPQDGCFLCPLPAGPERPPPPRVHVPAVLGCDVLQCSAGKSLQGLGLQQLLYGYVAGHPLPIHPACHLHHRHHPSLLWLWTLQVMILRVWANWHLEQSDFLSPSLSAL